VGLLRRGPDFPRTAVVCLTVDAVPEDMAELPAFCSAARLRPGQSLNLDLADVAHEAGLSLYGIEDKLLVWSDAGLLRYNLAGRDLLLELLPPPEDATNRVETLLERYTTIQLQRVDEIVAYAKTHRCRHGHINAYLGGRPIDRCDACDNCVELSLHADPGLPGDREQLLTILRCASEGPWSWGRRSLTRILRGDAKGHQREQPLNQRACGNACFGALSFRSDQAIEWMLDILESGGFLRAQRLGHGGVILDITPAGQAALRDPITLDRVLPATREREPSQPRPPRRSVKRSAKKDAEGLEVDETLFQTLRAWRLEQARVQQVAPFVVLHNRVLRAIAAHHPTTLEALSELKGIGPYKLETYGQQVIELVRDYLKREAEGSESRDQGGVD
jgi:superfamily II DNA helicase RecQ